MSSINVLYWFLFDEHAFLGYINEGGKLNLARLEIFMAKLGTVDRDLFREHYSDIKGMDTDLVSQYLLLD